MCGARRNSEKSWSTCMRIRCRESWCNIRRTGLGEVGRTTRGRERVEFGLIQTEEARWKQQVRGRVKTRTLNTEGCGPPPQSQNQLPNLRHPPGNWITVKVQYLGTYHSNVRRGSGADRRSWREICSLVRQ